MSSQLFSNILIIMDVVKQVSKETDSKKENCMWMFYLQATIPIKVKEIRLSRRKNYKSNLRQFHGNLWRWDRVQSCLELRKEGQPSDLKSNSRLCSGRRSERDSAMRNQQSTFLIPGRRSALVLKKLGDILQPPLQWTFYVFFYL